MVVGRLPYWEGNFSRAMLNFGEVNGTDLFSSHVFFFPICFFPSDFLTINFLYSDLPVIVLGEKTTVQMFGRETPLSDHQQ